MRLALIEWEDSHAAAGWQEIGGTIEDRRSVGWLILDGEHAKVVAPHEGNGVMTIPARAVLRIIDLDQRNADVVPDVAGAEN